MGAEQDFWLEHLSGSNRFNRWVFSQFARHLGQSVLEVGCGTGNFTTLIAESGHGVTGIDISADYVKLAQSRLNRFADARVYCDDATTAQWTDTFHSVVLLDVLEHIKNDAEFLNRLSLALKPGGRLIVKVPAGPYLYSPMDEAIGHYRRYDKPSLANTIAAAGLSVVEMSYFNLPGILGWWLNGRILKRKTPPEEQINLFEFFVPLFKAVESVAPPRFGLSLIAVCESESKNDIA